MISHSITVNISKGIDRDDLAKFVESVPPGSKITTESHYVQGDRPWESPTITVKLSAEWFA